MYGPRALLHVGDNRFAAEAFQGVWGRRLRSRLAVVMMALLACPLGSLAGGKGGLSGSRWLGPGVTNHPVNVVPSSEIEVPADWPVDSGGAITCETCHWRIPSGNSRTPYLRGADEADPRVGAGGFCTNCHRSGSTRSARSMHWMAVGVAHVQPRESLSQASTGVLDRESRRCLGCHDGVTAAESRNPTPSNPRFRRAGDRGRNHPVGMRYRRGRRRGRNARLRPSSTLPRHMRLPNGRVGCVSCHDLYSTERKRLAAPMEGSQLCYTCHEM